MTTFLLVCILLTLLYRFGLLGFLVALSLGCAGIGCLMVGLLVHQEQGMSEAIWLFVFSGIFNAYPYHYFLGGR